MRRYRCPPKGSRKTVPIRNFIFEFDENMLAIAVGSEPK